MKNNPIFVLLAIVLFAIDHQAKAQPQLLSYFKLNEDGQDSLGNSPAMELEGVIFSNNSLTLPDAGGYYTLAQISGFSYSNFAVSFDFWPDDFNSYPNMTLLSGGPLYRWLGLQNDSAGHLQLALNNFNQVFSFTNVITTNHWHTLACSVDLNSEAVLIMLDGQMLPEVILKNDFQFDVVGTSAEQSDKAFSFVNDGNASFFAGKVNNLRIYSVALSASEMDSIYAVNLSIQNFGVGEIIYWPADITGYVLQSTDSLLQPIDWQEDVRSPLLIGDQNAVVDTPALGAKFYRLGRL